MKSPRYKTEDEIRDVFSTFENATISRDAWKHAEHLTVALYFVSHYDFQTAKTRMRDGIFRLLDAFGVDLAKEMPYHETLTEFWMRQVAEFNSANHGLSLLSKANELVDRFDKDYPLKFYSREFLFSDEARATFLDGDLEKYSQESVVN